MVIKCELHKILGERRMHLSELQRETGLSYTTLHNLYYERSTRIDLNTIDQICRVLEIQPGELFKHEVQEKGSSGVKKSKGNK